MKRNIFLICTLLLISSTVFSQSIKFGFGPTAGTKMKVEYNGKNIGYGLNTRAVFSFAHKFGISGGISFYFPHRYKLPAPSIGEFRHSHFVTNIDFLYYIVNIPKVKFYALGGITNTTIMIKNIFMNTFEKTNENKQGFEMGTGVKIGPLFGEIKYETKMNQFMGTIGVFI